MKPFKIVMVYVWMHFACTINGQPKIIEGERLTYEVSYGILKVGEVVFEVDTALHMQNERVCHKATLTAKTKGIAGFFTKIYDVWTSYIDTSRFVPYQFNRFQQENNYELIEYTEFNHEQAECYVMRKKNDKTFDVKTFPFPLGTLDAISALYSLRNIDLAHLKKNDTITIQVFLEDTTHRILLKNIGTKKLKTVAGKLRCVALSPVIPIQKNSFLIADNPIKVWFTPDSRHIPVLIKMETKYGDVNIELEEYATNPRLQKDFSTQGSE